MKNYDYEYGYGYTASRMNPIKEAWGWLGFTIWKRRYRGSQRKRAIAAEAQVALLRQQLRDNISRSFESGWQAGWREAMDMAGITFTAFQRPEEPEVFQ